MKYRAFDRSVRCPSKGTIVSHFFRKFPHYEGSNIEVVRHTKYKLVVRLLSEGRSRYLKIYDVRAPLGIVKNENAAITLAGNAKIRCPIILESGTLDIEGFRTAAFQLTEEVEGQPLSELGDADLATIQDALWQIPSRLGTVTSPVHGSVDIAAQLYLDELEYIEALDFIAATAFEKLRKTGSDNDLNTVRNELRQQLRSAFNHIGSYVLCHRDLSLDNIFEKDGHLTVIDWELAAFCDPWLDRARLITSLISRQICIEDFESLSRSPLIGSYELGSEDLFSIAMQLVIKAAFGCPANSLSQNRLIGVSRDLLRERAQRW